MKLSNYPPGIQELLKEAGHHLKQLEILEQEFIAWQEAQVRPRKLLLSVSTRADLARAQWVRRTKQGGIKWVEKQ